MEKATGQRLSGGSGSRRSGMPGNSEEIALRATQVCLAILQNARTALYLDMRYLDLPLSALSFRINTQLEGIGTDRNVGYGFFEYAADTLSIDLPDSANHQLSLSLFIPESREQLKALMNSEQVAYDFVRRGGWITTYPYTTLRKNAIYGFLPGSVFCKDANTAVTVIGKIADLKPEADLGISHHIWRNGKAIMLPINLK